MDNFKIIYKILRHLEMSMDCEETDTAAISASRLDITKPRWEQILILMQDDGYITGIVCAQDLSSSRRHIVEPIRPVITIKGLEYFGMTYESVSSLEKIEDWAYGKRYRMYADYEQYIIYCDTSGNVDSFNQNGSKVYIG